MGLSGSGKSTLVRLINRLIEPTSGSILIDGIDITKLNDKELLQTRREKISMVFQAFALMPHMNIIDNVAFGLELNGVDKQTRYEKALKALTQVGLEHHSESYPDELSGGMQQRVGIARGLANDPEILLMDEAFSALDPLIRTEMQDELLKLQETMQKTIVFISHDLDEAIRIGDRIAIMEGGEVVQVGTPEEIISNPANQYVKAFFQGVDVTSVLTASHVAKKINPTIINKESIGLKSTLQYLGDYDQDFGYFLGKNNTYLGVITIESLQNAKKENGSLQNAIINQETISCYTPIANLISVVAQCLYPVAVVDENNRYLGTISKSRLLKVLDQGVENGN
jgi:glycine betaine/proline transport system ATP-binding protein